MWRFSLLTTFLFAVTKCLVIAMCAKVLGTIKHFRYHQGKDVRVAAGHSAVIVRMQRAMTDCWCSACSLPF